jgi:hypothetical protein
LWQNRKRRREKKKKERVGLVLVITVLNFLMGFSLEYCNEKYW